MSKNNNTSNFFDAIKNIRSDIVLPKPELPNLEVDTTELEQKWADEVEIRKLQLQKLRQNVNANLNPIVYNLTNSTISFRGKDIPIPPNTNEEALCKVLFTSKNSMKRLWSWDEIVEKWGDDVKDRNQKEVYSTGRRINMRIAQKTMVEDALIVKTKTIRINPKYLSK